jgi:hypothetical protein
MGTLPNLWGALGCVSTEMSPRCRKMEKSIDVLRPQVSQRIERFAAGTPR